MDEIKSSADWIEAYLEWTDAQSAAPSASPAEDFVAACLSSLNAPESDPAALREAALLVALRTESDCVRLVRQTLESANPSPSMITIAIDALGQADRLLEDERSAWHALARSHHLGAPIAADWPHAIDCVAADVHALAAKVMALHPH